MKSKRVRTDVLEIAYEEHGPDERRAGDPAARLPLRRPRLRRGRPAAGRRRLPRAGALAARLRPDAVPVGRHAALGRAGGARPRPAAVHGRARHRAGRAGRLRLGRPRRLHRGGAVARAGALPGELHRLQHPEHRGLGRAGAGRAGASLLVPVLLPHRARPRRPHQEPARHLPAAVEAVVAGMARSTRRPSRRAPSRSTIPTSSTS